MPKTCKHEWNYPPVCPHCARENSSLGAYKVAITNVARYIKSRRDTSEDGASLDGYTASTVLAVAFCKAKEEVLADIMQVDD